MILPTDEQLQKFGYGPGWYMGKCVTCNVRWDCQAKGSWHCRECAVKLFQAQGSATAGERSEATSPPRWIPGGQGWPGMYEPSQAAPKGRECWVTYIKPSGKFSSISAEPPSEWIREHKDDFEFVLYREVLNGEADPSPSKNLHPEAISLAVDALKHCRMVIVDGIGYRPKFADEKEALRIQIDNVLELLAQNSKCQGLDTQTIEGGK